MKNTDETKCNREKFEFRGLFRKKVEVAFDAASVTSDAGVLLLREVEQKTGLLKSVSESMRDSRNPLMIKYNSHDLLTQRVFFLACGYEDLNDHNHLKNDPAFKVAMETKDSLASSPSLCRMEARADRQAAVAACKVLVEFFIKSQKEIPTELILDFDATDDIVHGNQEGRFFHGYYGNYCFLPLYVTCGSHLLVPYLRTSKKDGAKHAWAILSLLVKRFRKEWPNIKIIFRGDGGFCRHRIFTWCEKHGVDYIVGLAKNERLKALARDDLKKSKLRFEETKEKQRLFSWVKYGAKTWGKERNIICKAEHSADGENPRFVVTSLTGDPATLYDKVYCARGEMENRIKEFQLDLFSDRTSCEKWWPNQWRVIESALAYTLINYIRVNELKNTGLANATVGTIRLKLFKIGAQVIENTRKIKFMFSAHYPYKEIFRSVAAGLMNSS